MVTPVNEAQTEGDPDASEPEEDGLSEGDIVLVDFEAWTDEDDLFDTTRRDVAEEAGWDVGDEEELEPMPVLLGGGRIVPGFEEALLDAEVGEDEEIDVPPTQAFGLHDSDRVRTFPRRDFEKKEIEPHPGTRVEINGQQGIVVQATASRVRVDFNHPFAGRTLSYSFRVLEKVTGAEDKVKALIGLDYDTEEAGAFEVDIDGDGAVVTVPEEASFAPEWFMAKHRLGHDVFEHTDLEEIRFVDTVTREQMEDHDHGHGHGHTATAPQSAATGAFDA